MDLFNPPHFNLFLVLISFTYEISWDFDKKSSGGNDNFLPFIASDNTCSKYPKNGLCHAYKSVA